MPPSPPSAELRPIPCSEIALVGTYAAIGEAGDWLAEWLAPRRLPTDLAFALRLCLEEVLANIVMHSATELRPNILASLAEWPGGLTLTISDDGIAFDPVNAKSPKSAEIGGNGLILLRRYSSAMDYQREAGRNRLTLSFSLPV